MNFKSCVVLTLIEDMLLLKSSISEVSFSLSSFVWKDAQTITALQTFNNFQLKFRDNKMLPRGNF